MPTDWRYFRKIAEQPNPEFLCLPGWVRGYSCELIRAAQRPDGRLAESVRAMAVLLRLQPDEHEMFERAVTQLSEAGFLEQHEGSYRIRNFRVAQESADARRQREWRANRKKKADVTPVTDNCDTSQPVTVGHVERDMSQPVTVGHAERDASQSVTGCHYRVDREDQTRSDQRRPDERRSHSPPTPSRIGSSSQPTSSSRQPASRGEREFSRSSRSGRDEAQPRRPRATDPMAYMLATDEEEKEIRWAFELWKRKADYQGAELTHRRHAALLERYYETERRGENWRTAFAEALDAGLNDDWVRKKAKCSFESMFGTTEQFEKFRYAKPDEPEVQILEGIIMGRVGM